MKLTNFLDGLAILRRHYEDSEGYYLGAEHDIIYLYSTETPLTRDEVEQMHSLGWFQPDGPSPPGGWSPDCYDHNEGWAVFT